jgi:hypothetical protein
VRVRQAVAAGRWLAKVEREVRSVLILNIDNKTRSICIVDERGEEKENKKGKKGRKAILSERLMVEIYVQSEKLRNRD